MGQFRCGERKQDDSVVADDVGILVGAKSRAAIFDDPQAAGGHLADDAMVEADDAVGHEVEELVLGGGLAVAMDLGGQDVGQAAVDEPFVEAIQFIAFAFARR